jgi:hypothetical protein
MFGARKPKPFDPFSAVNQFHQVAAQAPAEAAPGSQAAPGGLRSLHGRTRGLGELYGALQGAWGGGSNHNGMANVTPTDLGGDVLGKLMNAIRTKESGGKYDARGQSTKYGVARGAYQFLPSTYSSFAKQIGVNPNDWSQASQDKVARHAMQSYMRQFGNDPRKVAIAWYAGPGAVARSSAALNARQSAGGSTGNMPSINAYANAILKLMGG